ncbi:hypothetical protein BY458DRAFT_499182 [Sporodiniella umbellata]|nr:hypothetical protein BY458DRAFT_499182 [Sporodiniella umbellata]
MTSILFITSIRCIIFVCTLLENTGSSKIPQCKCRHSNTHSCIIHVKTILFDFCI